MSSASGSGNESDRSASPVNNGPAPTPGHRLSRSASNSPARSRSGTPASGNRSRSGSPSSNKSGGTQKSGGSRKSRSRSVASNASNRSRSPASHRTGSGSHRSSSAGSGKSQSRSGSAASSKSGSRSGSAASKKSGSRSRSGSAASKKSGSRSGSAASKKSGSRSRSGSAASQKSGSRSGSAASNRSGTPESRRSRSRSGSAASNRSRSVASNRSGTRSRSQSPTKPPEPQERSRSNSPNLHIDESGSPQNDRGDNRLRDSSEERTIKKKNRKITSDSEEDEDNVQTGKEVSAAAIFGDDADDISSEDDKDEKGRESDKDGRRSDDERRSDEEHEQREGEEDEGKENEPEPIPETRIDVEIPKISCDLGRDIHFVKLPNFLSVDTRPFDPETYEDEIDEEETLDEEGRARLKLKVENTIRWREIADKEGNTQKQSNARLVRWSDGSYSLHLGSEIFDVYKQPLQGDHNHLFIRQGTGLQGQAVFRTKLSFRPHSTESFTHRKMTLSLADRSQKTSGIKILSQVGADPDQDRKMLLKKEEEKLRQTVRVSKPRRKGDPARSHSTAYREEEGSDEEGAISLNAIKNKYKSGAAMAAKGGAIYSSDEDGSDIETRGKKRDKAKVSKVLRDSDSNEESE